MLVANWRDLRSALSGGAIRLAVLPLSLRWYVRSNGNCCLSDFSTELANGGGG